jgi:iron uptake system EfeUOB component EfeO/EfeM
METAEVRTVWLMRAGEQEMRCGLRQQASSEARLRAVGNTMTKGDALLERLGDGVPAYCACRPKEKKL